MALEFSWVARVYYEDTDAAGVVFYANYLKFFERARTEWLRALGFQQTSLSEEYQGLSVVKRLAVEYHAPALLDDALRVTVKIEKIGRASLALSQQVWREERLLVSATVTICWVDSKHWRPVPLPVKMRERILAAYPPKGDEF